MNWKLYPYVIRGKYRKDVVLALDVERTPTQIAKKIKIPNSHVSRSLAELGGKKIVVCLTPKAITGRIYELTKLGKEIREHLEKSEK